MYQNDTIKKNPKPCRDHKKAEHFRPGFFNTKVELGTKLCFETKSTKLYSKMLLVKSPANKFVFSPAFYLIMCFMKAPKNFGKRAILKI